MWTLRTVTTFGTYSSTCRRPSGALHLDYSHIKHLEYLATHTWYVVLHLATCTNLSMAQWFFSSLRIWSHSLGALRLWWTAALCIYCVLGLLYFFHVAMRCVEFLVVHQWSGVFHLTTYSILSMTWWFCSSHQIWSHSLDALRLIRTVC